MSECAQCGRQLTAAEAGSSLCDICHQRSFAVQAEDSAESESQQHFLITNILLGINVAVFAVMLWNHVPLLSPTSDQIIRWGGNYGPLTLGAQPWRLITNIFEHIGLAHIVANMWALIVLGRLAESLYGRASFLFTYLITGLAGSLASLLWNPMGVSAGASGALFGIAGALIATLYAGRLPLPKHVIKPVLWTLVFWAAFDLGYGFWKTGVDNAAHVGGFLTGVVIGYPLGHHLGLEIRARQFRKLIFAFAFLALAIFGGVIWRLESYVVPVERASRLIAENKADQAIALLQPALNKNPRNTYLHLLLAQAYVRTNNFNHAERELKIASEISPGNAAIWRSLAEIYLRQKRWEDAANAYAKAAGFAKDNGISWFDAGLAYRQLDRNQEAAEAFRNCLAVNKYFGDAWYQLGISLMNLKQNQQAVAALQEATRLLPNSPDAHLWLGNALLSIGRQDEANVEFLKSFQLRALQQRVLQGSQQQQLRQQQRTSPQPK